MVPLLSIISFLSARGKYLQCVCYINSEECSWNLASLFGRVDDKAIELMGMFEGWRKECFRKIIISNFFAIWFCNLHREILKGLDRGSYNQILLKCSLEFSSGL